jgi:hypothetical protein
MGIYVVNVHLFHVSGETDFGLLNARFVLAGMCALTYVTIPLMFAIGTVELVRIWVRFAYARSCKPKVWMLSAGVVLTAALVAICIGAFFGDAFVQVRTSNGLFPGLAHAPFIVRHVADWPGKACVFWMCYGWWQPSYTTAYFAAILIGYLIARGDIMPGVIGSRRAKAWMGLGFVVGSIVHTTVFATKIYGNVSGAVGGGQPTVETLWLDSSDNCTLPGLEESSTDETPYRPIGAIVIHRSTTCIYANVLPKPDKSKMINCTPRRVPNEKVRASDLTGVQAVQTVHGWRLMYPERAFTAPITAIAVSLKLDLFTPHSRIVRVEKVDAECSITMASTNQILLCGHSKRIIKASNRNERTLVSVDFTVDKDVSDAFGLPVSALVGESPILSSFVSAVKMPLPDEFEHGSGYLDIVYNGVFFYRYSFKFNADRGQEGFALVYSKGRRSYGMVGTLKKDSFDRNGGWVTTNLYAPNGRWFYDSVLPLTNWEQTVRH